MAFRENWRRSGRAFDRAHKRSVGTARWITQGRHLYRPKSLLTAELLAGVGLVAVRAVADYEPQADGTLKGKIGHPSGQYGPLPVLAGLLGTFFLLSFLAARGGRPAKTAVAFGALVDLVLAMKSSSEFEAVAATFSTFGKAKTPAGKWQTTGYQAGSPLAMGTGTYAGGGSGNSGGSGNGQIVKPTNGKCPKGYHYDKTLRLCIPPASSPKPFGAVMPGGVE